MFLMSSRASQGKHSRYAAGSSSRSRQSAAVEHVEFDNTRFIRPLQQAQFYNLAERFFLNTSNQHVHFKRCDMNTKGQLYATLLFYNIKLMSLTSTIPIDKICLLYYMIKGWKIDVVHVTSNEILKIAISGHSHVNKTAMTLGFLALITGLCRQVGVEISDVDTKSIGSVVNEDYVLRYCVSKLA
ncbi:hypothetical protein RYX36_013626, partial [Vicia faba]